jgi:hypothetical protein
MAPSWGFLEREKEKEEHIGQVDIATRLRRLPSLLYKLALLGCT